MALKKKSSDGGRLAGRQRGSREAEQAIEGPVEEEGVARDQDDQRQVQPERLQQEIPIHQAISGIR